MKNIATLSICILFISTLCFGQNAYEYSLPKDLGDGWKTNDLKSQGIDSTLIYTFFNQIKGGFTQIA